MSLLPIRFFCISLMALMGMTVPGLAQGAGAGGWKVTAGPLWRSMGRVSFGSGTQGLGFLAGLNGSLSTTPAGGLVPGIYDNGFILPDLNGGSTTSNFGWDATTDIAVSSQNESFRFVLNRSSTQTLTETFTGLPSNGGSSHHLNGAGAFLRLESPALATFGGASLSFDLGYSWTGLSVSRLQTGFAGLLRTTTTRTLVSDDYGGADFGVTPGVYTGSPAGGPEIPLAPLASGSQQVVVQRAIIVDSEFNRSFGLDLQTLSLGPRLTWQTPDGRVQFGLSTGLAVNLASWRATSTETLRERGGSVLGSWTNHGSGHRLLPGWYLETSVSARLSEAWLGYLAARYDQAPKLTGSDGGGDFSLDLSGWTVLSGLTFEF